MGLTTPSRKKIIVTETNARETIIGGNGDDTSQGTGQMTDVNQTLQGVDTPTMDSLKPESDEGDQRDMGSPGTTSTRQKPMAFSDRGLMCFKTRRGLRNS